MRYVRGHAAVAAHIPTRREVLVGLVASACVARRRSVEVLATGQVTLGWRLVPGTELVYRSVVERRAGGVVVSRAEAWTYVVHELDHDDVATLIGRMTGLGVGAEVAGSPVGEAEVEAGLAGERDASRPVRLRIAMDGRLESLDRVGFGSRLRHQLLGLRLPTTPAALYDEWPDPELVRGVLPLLPPSLEVHSQAHARLVELSGSEHDNLVAVESSGAVRAGSGPAIALDGTTLFNARRGVLQERRLTARFSPTGPDTPGNPGALTVRLVLV